MNKKTMTLVAFAALAMAAPIASAQVYTRDHRRPAPTAPEATVRSMSPSSGLPGTSVVVRGTGFDTDAALWLGNVKLAPTAYSSRSITFVVPAMKAGSQALVLRNGRSSVALGNFHIDDPPPPPPPRKYETVPAQRDRGWSSRYEANDRRERDLRNTRHSRRNQRIERMKARWQRAFLADPKTKRELTIHARRTAQLERMLRIATVRGDRKLVNRIKVAIKREDKRHDRTMTSLEQSFRS